MTQLHRHDRRWHEPVAASGDRDDPRLTHARPGQAQHQRVELLACHLQLAVFSEGQMNLP